MNNYSVKYKCSKCGKSYQLKELVVTGFERKLITRGKNKGHEDIKYFYSCPDCDKKPKE